MVKGGSIDLILRNFTFRPQGTANVMLDRKPRGRPRTDAPYRNQLLLPQRALKEFSEITNPAILPPSNIESSQNLLPQSLSLPESKPILNSLFPQPNSDLALLNDTPVVSSPIPGLPSSDSGHNLPLSTSINKIPAITSPTADSTILTHSMTPGKYFQRKK